MTIGNLWDYYIARAAHIAARDNRPDDLPDAKAWQKLRPQVHEQYMISLGLDPMPDKCDLRATVTGTFAGEGYTAEKIAYQILPDVWSSAHVYRPATGARDGKLPGVLYTCGHHRSGVVGYQHHAIAWARRGYVCLIFDTIEQHDNPGEHHGLHPGRTPYWIDLGYSGAGGEVLNGIRALDLLIDQPDVDPQRVGVTGLSGGGSQSFRLAAADDRLKAVATIAGVSDPAFAIASRTVEQHCDCMYDHNRFARDASVWGALIAPRALLYCFARHDNLYTPEEFRAIHRHTQQRYDKLGCAERCQLVEYDGPHGYGTNPKPTTDAIHDWFDTHVAGERHPAAEPLAIRDAGEVHDEPTLSVFHGVTPEPNRLDLLPELISPRGQVRLPESAAEWAAIRTQAIDRLMREVFHLLDDVNEPQTLEQVGDWTHVGLDRLEWDGELDAMRQTVSLYDPADATDQAVVIGLGDRAATSRQTGIAVHHAGAKHAFGAVGIEPRGGGRTAPHPSQRTLLEREGCLTGLTPTMMLIQDLHHLMPRIERIERVRNRPIYLYGQGEGAVAMLYYALLHPSDAVQGVILEGLPRSHSEGTYPILGIRRVMDLAHAVGLLAPTPVTLIARRGTPFDWHWAERAHARLSTPTTLREAPTLAAALDAMCATTPEPAGT